MYDTFINGGSENREEDEHLGVMTRNKAKRIEEDKFRSQFEVPYTRERLKKLEEEIKKIHHLQLLKEVELEEFKEWNALNLEEIIFYH